MANAKKVREKPLVKVVVVIILIIASLLGVNINDWLPTDGPEQVQTTEGVLTITMIDVGQADCFLLEQDGKTMLIDFGLASTADEVIAYLEEQGITRLDYALGTHPHDDHEGGMQKIITSGIEIGTVIMPEVTKMKITTAWYTSLMKELSSKVYNEETEQDEPKYNLVHPKVNDVYMLGDATITVLGPIEEPKSNKNNYSIVLKVTFGTMDIIFTGDAETAVEKDILESGADLDAEILKVGHHGSDTSSSDAFLDAISPDYALISAGVGNSHEHPIESVMDKFEERNITVYRTDESGTVVVTVTSDNATFSVEPGDYLSGVELAEKEGVE